jgi:hypothetical protein
MTNTLAKIWHAAAHAVIVRSSSVCLTGITVNGRKLKSTLHLDLIVDFVYLFYMYSHYFMFDNLVHSTLFIITFLYIVYLHMHFSVSPRTYLYFANYLILYIHASFHYRLINLHTNSLIKYAVYILNKSSVNMIVM